MRCLASHLALAYPFLLAVVIGCTSGSDVAQTPEADPADKQADTAAPAPASPEGTSELKIYKDKDGLNTLVAPYTPPKLEELEKSVEWVEQPVIDTIERLENHRRQQPTPISDEAALQLRNDSPENNKKILGALGRSAEGP